MKPFSALLIMSLMLAPLVGCERTPQPYRTPDMESLPPRLQKLFAQTKPVCFGRFIIDVPVGTEIGWGPTEIPYEIVSYPGEAGKTHLEIKAKIAEYEGKKHKTEPAMLLAVRDGPNKESKIVVGYDDNLYNTSVNIHAYLRLPPHAFVMTAKGVIAVEEILGHKIAPEERWPAVLADLSDASIRVRVRADVEIPTEPGICIESGFVAGGEDNSNENISIGFRILPDVHLSIRASKTSSVIESHSLEYAEDSLVKGRKDAEKKGFGAEYAKIKWLRKGRRELLGQIGFEYATRQPASKGNAHEFQFATPGEPKNPFKPVFEIELDTGADGDQPGQAKSSLSDDEAIALWDKILSTLRVRPTTLGKSGDAGGPNSPNPVTPKRLPLKSKVTSAVNCPQTGVWECAPGTPGIAEHRRFIEAGQGMPYGLAQRPARGLGRFIGMQEDDAVEITWTLVAYEKDAS